MKVGTLIQHHRKGKGFVIEVLREQTFPTLFEVAWLKSHTSASGYKVATSVIWRQRNHHHFRRRVK